METDELKKAGSYEVGRGSSKGPIGQEMEPVVTRLEAAAPAWKMKLQQ